MEQRREGLLKTPRAAAQPCLSGPGAHEDTGESQSTAAAASPWPPHECVAAVLCDAPSVSELCSRGQLPQDCWSGNSENTRRPGSGLGALGSPRGPPTSSSCTAHRALPRPAAAGRLLAPSPAPWVPFTLLLPPGSRLALWTGPSLALRALCEDGQPQASCAGDHEGTEREERGTVVAPQRRPAAVCASLC